MRKSCWNRIHDLSIKWKILLIYLIAGIVPILSIGTYSMYSNYKRMLDFETKQQNSYLFMAKKEIFNLTNQCYNVGRTLCYNTELKKILASSYESEDDIYKKLRNFNLLDSYMGYYAEISDVHVYTVNMTLRDYGHISVVDEETKEQEWYQKAMEEKGVPFWYQENVPGKGPKISLIQYMRVPESDSYAVLTITISNSCLTAWMDSIKYQYMIALDEKEVIYASNKKDTGKELPFLSSRTAKISDPYYPQYRGSKVMAMDFSIYGVNTNDQFQVVVINNCFDTIKDTMIPFYIMMGIVILLPLVLIVLFSNAYTRRVRTVRDEMHHIAHGDLNLEYKIEGHDELGELFIDMQETIHNISELQKQVYEEHLAAKELENVQQQMQFELLASQINPHFLFNTLESIRMQAALEKKQELARIILQLGKMLRFSLENKRSEVPLAEELSYLESYFEIQKFRFGDKIDCGIFAQPGLDTKQIYTLPLLIQPFVENSFQHGLKGVGAGGKISVEVLVRGETLEVMIRDNGKGMEKEELENLKKRMKEPVSSDGRSIGICNVYHRIQMFYKEGYDVEISSKAGEGTSIEIKIPCRRK